MGYVNRKFYGKVIYATPGSGKSYLADRYDDIIDGDELLCRAIALLEPSFSFKKGVDPRINLNRFFRAIRFNKSLMDTLYKIATLLIGRIAESGKVVLIGTVKLMYLADYVYIQTNASYVRHTFKQEKEEMEVERLELDRSTLRYMNNYLEEYLIRGD